MRTAWYWLLVSLFSAASFARPQVTFLVPDDPGSLFWSEVSGMMKLVAEDLDLELELIHSSSRNQLLNQAVALTRRDKKPDYVVSILYRHSAGVFLNILNDAQIPVFIINTPKPAEEQQSLGVPRGKYGYWLGHSFPDDVDAGYQQAKLLYQQLAAQREFSLDKPLKVVALAGGRTSEVAFERNKGLLRFVAETPEMELKQLVFTDWSDEKAQNRIQNLLERYPDTLACWSASDAIALGGIVGAAESQRIAGEDFFVAGIDWAPKAINAVAQGDMLLTLGGHFVEGAQALIWLYDHHHGVDFARREGLIVRNKMMALTRQDAKQMQQVFTPERLQQVDYAQFSYHQYPNSAVSLSIDNLLEELTTIASAEASRIQAQPEPSSLNSK